VRDHAEQALAYVYFEEKPGRRSAAKLLSKDEARRIAVNIAKLPEFDLSKREGRQNGGPLSQGTPGFRGGNFPKKGDDSEAA
jgi:hypothetical protein